MRKQEEIHVTGQFLPLGRCLSSTITADPRKNSSLVVDGLFQLDYGLGHFMAQIKVPGVILGPVD